MDMKPALLAPRSLGSLALLFAVLFVAAALSVVLLSPFTGVTLEARDGLVVVAETNASASRVGVEPGAPVSALIGNGLRIDITPLHLETRRTFAEDFSSPGALYRFYGDVNEAMAGDTVELETSNGSFLLRTDEARPLDTLGWQFWFRLGCAVTAWLIGMSLLIWQAGNPVNQLASAIGAGFTSMWASSAVLYGQTEMFFLPISTYELLVSLQAVGALMAVVSLCAIPLYFPEPLPQASRWLRLLLLVTLGWLVAVALIGDLRGIAQPFVLPTGMVFDAAPLLFTVAVFFWAEQWRRQRNDAVTRAQMQWFLLALIGGPTLWFVLYWVPRAVDQAPLLPLSFAPLPILISFALIVVGIARHPLFQYERYVASIFRWWGLLVAICALDVALIGLGLLGTNTVLFLTLLLLLWVYLPLRFRLARLFSDDSDEVRRVRTYESILELVDSASTEECAYTAFQRVLQQVFEPLEIRRVDWEGDAAVSERGRTLRVPATDYTPALELDSKLGGRGLFNEQDSLVASLLIDVFVRLFRHRDAFQAGKAEERQRISRDLHDHVASNLLSMVYSASDDRTRSLASDTLNQIRDLLRALKRAPVPFSSMELKIIELLTETTRLHGLRLDLQRSEGKATAMAISTTYLNVINIVRELLNNTLRHAGAGAVSLSMDMSADGFELRYSDDGGGYDVDEVTMGNGLRNIESRVAEMHGRIEWPCEKHRYLQISLPLASNFTDS